MLYFEGDVPSGGTASSFDGTNAGSTQAVTRLPRISANPPAVWQTVWPVAVSYPISPAFKAAIIGACPGQISNRPSVPGKETDVTSPVNKQASGDMISSSIGFTY